MALIEVKGKVTKLFWEDKGLEVTESFTTKAGQQRDRRYTVWLPKKSVFQVGDDVNVKGLYSAELDTYTDKNGETKNAIKVSINNPLVTYADGAVPGSPTHEELPF